MTEPAPGPASTHAGGPAPVLSIHKLVMEFRSGDLAITANSNVSLSVSRGKTLGVVGESGSGKSVLCRNILRLISSPPGYVVGGQIWFEGQDLLTLSEKEMARIRGTKIKMVFQNPMTSLNPVWTVGDQITEGLRVHYRLSNSQARKQGIDLLGRVGIPSPRLRYDEYPFQWSGGMLQRAVIAMAMAGEPTLLLADEPTTALDVTIQDQILTLLMEIQDRADMAMILVSHDMAVIAETCDTVAVMYSGQIVEVAPTSTLFETPRHPYTAGLMSSIPRHAQDGSRLKPIMGQPPNLAELPNGCPFAERCQFSSPDCTQTPTFLREITPGHSTACLYPERLGEVA